ncbi:peptidase U32 family protein [Pontiella agarivorans]|uniref:U32 family peptidase n=1 Tax=Pontiella agarivorans TaxID=3038953 RepID=A0ABU5MUI7_9BACT|nr:peptidase U32 family protein [Pontiella agarivorans]MDZ8117766.1 U32 family peptidase [Pontiella agarivorans]
MNKKNSRFELMAPAGSYASLAAAIRGGADSVYFGVDQLNMRSRAASPFTLDDLRRIARICRWCGVKSYLALNVIVYDEELEIMRTLCDAAKAANLSAIIASDISAIEYAHSIGLEVHISVQANISNIGAVKFFARYADVMVLARELTLAQIAAIRNGIIKDDVRGPGGEPVQLELFAHGALCVAISGKCYMSLGCYNQSANRGSCFQNCRRAYRLVDVDTGDELEVQNRYIMSPKDLCTLPHLDKLAEAGVTVFKLEGRARTAQYVSTVTKAYRRGLDAVEDGTFEPEHFQPLEAGLAEVFNRGFWDGGYYCGEKMGEWAASGHSQATHKRVEQGLVTNYFAKIGIAEFRLWQHELKPGCEILIEGPTTGAVQFNLNELRVDGKPADRAVKNDMVTFRVPEKVRRNDKVFLLQPVVA